MTTEARLRPVKLQINNSGAWKDVTHFDAGDALAWAHVRDAAKTLGEIDVCRVRYRVVTEDVLPEVLMNWNKDDGWKQATAQG